VSIEAVIVGDDKLRAKVQSASGTIDGKLVDSMGRITIRLQAHVVRNKLSGQVLKVRTNNLRGSIHQEVSRDGSGLVTAVLLALSLPVLAPWWIPLIGTAFALIEYFIRDSQPAKSAAPQEEEGI